MFKLLSIYSIVILLIVSTWCVNSQSKLSFQLKLLNEPYKLNKILDLASDLKIADICVGNSRVINCTTSLKNQQSIVFDESFYGVQKAGTSNCGYKYLF